MKIRLKVYHPLLNVHPGQVADVADRAWAERLIAAGNAEPVPEPPAEVKGELGSGPAAGAER